MARPKSGSRSLRGDQHLGQFPSLQTEVPGLCGQALQCEAIQVPNVLQPPRVSNVRGNTRDYERRGRRGAGRPPLLPTPHVSYHLGGRPAVTTSLETRRFHHQQPPREPLFQPPQGGPGRPPQRETQGTGHQGRGRAQGPSNWEQPRARGEGPLMHHHQRGRQQGEQRLGRGQAGFYGHGMWTSPPYPPPPYPPYPLLPQPPFPPQ